VNTKSLARVTAVLALLLAIVPLPAIAQTNKETERVRNFVQSFYDWYLRMTRTDHLEDPMRIALRSKSSAFAPALRRALLQDVAAQSKNPNEVVGLDFDPFLNSQDPYKSYKVTSVKLNKQSFHVEVEGVDAGKLTAQNSIVAIVVKAQGKYRFTNFQYPSLKTDLLTLLRNADRGIH